MTELTQEGRRDRLRADVECGVGRGCRWSRFALEPARAYDLGSAGGIAVPAGEAGSADWDGPLPSALIDEQFSIEVSETDHTTVLRVTGEVAYSTCRLLQEALVPHVTRGNKVVLDFSEVPVLDSSGIGVVLRAHRALADVGGTLVVRDPTPATLRVLEITGLQDLLVEP